MRKIPTLLLTPTDHYIIPLNMLVIFVCSVYKTMNLLNFGLCQNYLGIAVTFYKCIYLQFLAGEKQYVQNGLKKLLNTNIFIWN